MALTVVQPYEQLKVDNITMYIYGLPSMRKTSLAMTANDALLINFDNGAHRVDMNLRRCPVMNVESWREIQAIQKSDLQPFQTIIIDTAGTMQNCARSLVAEDKRNVFGNGVIKQQAQGIANSYLNTFINNLKNWKKDIVFIAHAIEDQDAQDRKILRPDLGGRLRQELYRLADCMALIKFEQRGNLLTHIMQFTANEEHLAKDCANLGTVALPELYQNPNFLGNLIQHVKDKVNSMSPEQIAQMKQQQELALWRERCNDAVTAKVFNQMMIDLKTEQDKGNPQCRAMWNILKPCGLAVGLIFDSEKAVWLESNDE